MNDTTKGKPRQKRTTGFLRGRFLQPFSWDVTARLYTFVHVLGSCPVPILTLPIVGRMTNSAHRTAQHTHIHGQLCKQLHPMKLDFLKENEIQTVKALKFKNSAKLKVGHYENYQTCWQCNRFLFSPDTDEVSVWFFNVLSTCFFLFFSFSIDTDDVSN